MISAVTGPRAPEHLYQYPPRRACYTLTFNYIQKYKRGEIVAPAENTCSRVLHVFVVTMHCPCDTCSKPTHAVRQNVQRWLSLPLHFTVNQTVTLTSPSL